MDNHNVIIVKGQQFVAYVGNQVEQAQLAKITKVRGQEKKPKALTRGMVADVVLKFRQTIFSEPGGGPFSRYGFFDSNSKVEPPQSFSIGSFFAQGDQRVPSVSYHLKMRKITKKGTRKTVTSIEKQWPHMS